MSGSGSLISATLEKIRGYVDDATSDQKYTDGFVLTHFLMPSIQEVQGRLSLSDGNPIVMPYRFNLVADQQHYELPPSVRTIMRMLQVSDDSDKAMIRDFRPRGELNPLGYGWRVLGHQLELDWKPKSTDLIEIRYVHNGDMCPHLETSLDTTDGTLTDYTTNGGKQRIELASAPDKGSIDRRTNGYSGQMLRLLPTAGPIEERIITRSYYDSGTTTWYAEVDLAFTTSAVDTQHSYEIVPYGFGSIWEAMAIRAAMRLASYRDVTQKQMQLLEREYSRALKTALDNVMFISSREAPHFQYDSVDSPDYYVLGDNLL